MNGYFTYMFSTSTGNILQRFGKRVIGGHKGERVEYLSSRGFLIS